METRAWVDYAVIGLKLCPFAKAPQVQGLVRYIVSNATTNDALNEDLINELQHLSTAPTDQVETTLLIHPDVLQEFENYNNFIMLAECTIEALDLEGIIQVAGFHPHYQFEGTTVNDITNATNRSPFPTIHLLRESSIEQAISEFGNTQLIYEKNIQTLERLGPEGWEALQYRCRLKADC
ncbi:MAG: DUF1415 domain-containing protein [Gammaproteobacteria bacterium]|nr:DUF1415 domain-containing protein [Gammaproteobacteria bacterium]